MNELFLFDSKYRILRNISSLLRLIVITQLSEHDSSENKNLQSLIQILNTGCFYNWEASKLISFEIALKDYYKENINHEL